jgi:hypothetical protein
MTEVVLFNPAFGTRFLPSLAGRFHSVISLGTVGLSEKSICLSWYLQAGIPQMSRSGDNTPLPPELAAPCPSQAAPNA